MTTTVNNAQSIVCQSLMQPFSTYVQSIEALLKAVLASEMENQTLIEATRILDGQPSEMLRRSIGINDRRSSGAFFSGSTLGEALAGTFTKPLNGQSRVFDPACGSGDLLLACSQRLPISEDLSTTLETWGRQLGGVDLYPEFIRAAKLRLMLAAALRTKSFSDATSVNIDSYFPRIRVGDGLEDNEDIKFATHVILNPPFGPMPTPSGTHWSSGQVSAAAVFMDTVITKCTEGTDVVAILPDVLRSGSRYGRWRMRLDVLANVGEVSIWGLFDSSVDVDVFLWQAIAGSVRTSESLSTWGMDRPDGSSVLLGSRANVSVGPLVPHRHVNRGRWQPYMHSRDLPTWGRIDVASLPKKRFSGTLFSPPFVAVRRTSRPVDSGRAIGTLVIGDCGVAVENHLLVVRPKDSSVEACEEVLRLLKEDRTDRWLNNRIRCRHLTVSALRELPWWYEGHD